MSSEYRMSITLDASGASSGVDNLAKVFARLEKYLSSMDKTLTRIEQGLSETGLIARKASLDLDKTSRSLDKVEKEARQAGDSAKEAGKEMAGMDGAVAKLNSTLGLLKNAFVGAMAFAGLDSIVQTADAMKTLDSQIKIATNSAEKHAIAMSEIERIAMANRVSLESVGGLYASNERALKQLGKSQQEVIKFTEQVTKAMRLGGGSAEGQAAALTQLGQALASGVLRGDEFNSIAEQAPMIMELMANSLNVTTGELRKMAGEGKLTADVVYKAMTSAEAVKKLEGMSKQTSTTIGGSLENVRTQWKLTVHELMNSEGGLSDIIAGGIDKIANGLAKFKEKIQGINENFSKLSSFISENSDVFISLAAAIGAAATAFGVLTFVTAGIPVIMKGVSAAFAALMSPIALTALAIGALVAAGVWLYQNWDMIKAKAEEVFDNLPEPVKEAIGRIKNLFERLIEFIEQDLPKIIAIARVVWDSFPVPTAVFETIKATVGFAMSSIGATIKAGVTIAASVFNAGFDIIKTVVSTVFKSINAIVRGDMEGFKEAISSGAKRALAIIKKMVSDIKQALARLGHDLMQAGRDAVQGFINGMDQKMGAVIAKAKELASRAKNAVTGFLDIRSPSRVMKQIGEWVSEGLAIGIAAKAPLAKKEAKKAAEAVKKAFDDELANLNHSILVNKLKLQGDPNAEFTADVVSGKYGDAKNLDKLYQTKQQALDIEQQVKAAESFNSTIKDLNRQIALMGNSDPIKELLYDFENTNKYAGYTTEQLQELESQLIALGKAKVNADFSDELKKSTDELNKQQYLLNNIGDKYAELRYSLAQKGFDTSQIEHIVSNTQQSDTMAQFRQWGAKNRDDALNADPLAKLQADFDAEMALITSFKEQKLLSEQDYLQRKIDLEAQFDAKSKALKVASYESQLSLASDLTKMLFGESSRAYKAIFAMEKGMALARVLLNNKVALANAWASAPFPKNMPAFFKTATETGALASAVSAIRPVIGQAHDGIMSVPKSGTWNLEKGERVLPKHTAKALDDKLDSMGNGGINITINVASDGTSTIDAQGANQTVKSMADRIKAVVLDTLRQERKQGGLLYA